MPPRNHSTRLRLDKEIASLLTIALHALPSERLGEALAEAGVADVQRAQQQLAALLRILEKAAAALPERGADMK